MSYLVFVQRVDVVINFTIYLGSSSKTMADKEKKKMEIQKFEYLKNENSYLD